MKTPAFYEWKNRRKIKKGDSGKGVKPCHDIGNFKNIDFFNLLKGNIAIR